MKYIDGFVIPVPKKNLAAYTAMSKKAGKIWKESGALDYKESYSDDVKSQSVISFATMAKASRTEVVVFAFIVYKSRKHRDKVNAQVMKDPRIASMCDPKKMPFDFKRMAYGGFQVMVDLF